VRFASFNKSSIGARKRFERGRRLKEGQAADLGVSIGAKAEAGRLGSLTPHLNTMGLDNFPVPCPCGRHPKARRERDGCTHEKDEACPFKADNPPKGMIATCCSLRGNMAARELEALGERALEARMYSDMTAEEALNFAEELRREADRLEAKHQHDAERPKGAGWNGIWNESTKTCEWQSRSTFEKALAEIRLAARWYEKVGSLGYGVHAWY